MSAPSELVLVANARLPSQRAQSLQVLQAAASFERAGARTQLFHARRANTPAASLDLFEHYQVPPGARPTLVAIPCVDWIERVPRALQFWPARLQEYTFSANAAKRVLRSHLGAVVLSREVECAHELSRKGYAALFLEIHRVPGGGARRGWLRAAARGALGLVAISGGVREDLLALGVAADAILVEHDAFEPTRFAAPPSRAEARRSLGLAPDARIVVYTGGLLEWKGVDVLLEAARALGDVTFVVAGGMQHEVARLRARAAGLANFRIDGFQPPARVVDYLTAADVGVAPNRSQPAISARYTSPLKLFEAMAVGLPLVASDLPALRELLTHGDDAWLVPPDDAAALAAGLRRVLDDPALRAALAQRFRRRAPHHTWDARAARILDWMAARGA